MTERLLEITDPAGGLLIVILHLAFWPPKCLSPLPFCYCSLFIVVDWPVALSSQYISDPTCEAHCTAADYSALSAAELYRLLALVEPTIATRTDASDLLFEF